MANMNDLSRIAAGTQLTGDFATPGDLRIDGLFEGKLYCGGTLTVGEQGVVKGTVVGNVVEFSGTMSGGTFYAKDTLALKSGCKVGGDIYAARLQVDLGAQFVGGCKLLDEGKFEKAAAPLLGMLPAEARPREEKASEAESFAPVQEPDAPEIPETEEVPEVPESVPVPEEKPAEPAKEDKSTLDSMAESWLGWQKRSR